MLFRNCFALDNKVSIDMIWLLVFRIILNGIKSFNVANYRSTKLFSSIYVLNGNTDLNDL